MEYYKKPDQNSKPHKYLIERMKGKTKTEAETVAYGKYQNNSSHIEDTKTYKASVEAMTGTLVSPREIAGEMNKIIKQDDDKSSKMNAIKEANKIHDVYPKDDIQAETGDLKITIRKT